MKKWLMVAPAAARFVAPLAARTALAVVVTLLVAVGYLPADAVRCLEGLAVPGLSELFSRP